MFDYIHENPKARILSNIDFRSINNRLLYMQGEFLFNDTAKSDLSMLPHEKDGLRTDRILNQMRFIPRHYQNTSKSKYIFIEDSNFFEINISMCPVNRCKFTFNSALLYKADAILLRSYDVIPKEIKANQILIVYTLEAPINMDLSNENDVLMRFNWTATYRFDASIVAPYYKVVAYDNLEPWPERYPMSDVDFSVNRTRDIAWYVSNCVTSNGRLRLGRLLGRYLNVYIIGKCGKLRCDDGPGVNCLSQLKHYWFYLSFENSNCRHYITEKFFRNALNSSVLPIVFGAHPGDYKLVAPPHSYIHVEDFPDLLSLVKYLKYLKTNSTAYNEYFAWKDYMKLDTNTFFWCRLCTMVHYADGQPQPDVPEMRKWWNRGHSCLKKPWIIHQYW